MPDTSLSPRRTPRQARSRVTHDAIMQAATQILSVNGLTGFNTNAIAERAGTSIGSIYQYFPNKDSLMLALIHRQKRLMLDNVAEAVKIIPTDDLEAAVRILIRAVMRPTRDNRIFATVIDQEEARLPIGEVIDEYLRRGGELFTRFLSRCDESSEGLDHHRVARTLPVMIQGIVDYWSNSSTGVLDVAEQEAVTAVLGYLRQQKASWQRSRLNNF